MQMKKKAAREYEHDLRDEIAKIKRQTGLVESGNAKFNEFFINWKFIKQSCNSLEDRRSQVRWLLRMLRKHLFGNLPVP